MHPFKKMILSLVLETGTTPPTGTSVSSLTGTSYLDSESGFYYVNVNLSLTASVSVNTVFEVQVDSGMMSTITILAGNSIGSDTLNTGSSSFTEGAVAVCLLSCDNTSVDYASVACPI